MLIMIEPFDSREPVYFYYLNHFRVGYINKRRFWQFSYTNSKNWPSPIIEQCNVAKNHLWQSVLHLVATNVDRDWQMPNVTHNKCQKRSFLVCSSSIKTIMLRYKKVLNRSVKKRIVLSKKYDSIESLFDWI